MLRLDHKDIGDVVSRIDDAWQRAFACIQCFQLVLGKLNLHKFTSFAVPSMTQAGIRVAFLHAA